MRGTKRFALLATCAAALLFAPAGAAIASSSHSAASLPKLDLMVSAVDPITSLPTAFAEWLGNPNTANPVLTVATGANPNVNGAYSYFDGVVTNTPVNGEALKDVNNIAFDYRGELGAGAPRISLGLSDGSFVYLSAGYSSAPLTDGWVQFNTDDRSRTQHNTLWGGGPAIIWDSLGHSYVSGDNGQTAWVNMAYGHGLTTTITSIDVVQDENHGIVQFDNLRFDTVVFVRGGVKAGSITVSPVI
jgi:hypothetical protein